MSETSHSQRLSQIQTLWTVVCQARDGVTQDAATAAQQQLVDRYRRVVHRYLLGAVRDPEAADELAQEFALRFIRGDLWGVDRQRGRFREFLKGVLSHLIGDFYRRRKKIPGPLPDQVADICESDAGQQDALFLDGWRAELLNRGWQALAQLEERSGQQFHTVLRFRAEHPDLRSEQMADELSNQLGKPLTAAGVRQTLHRAREKFAELLVDEVAQTLRDPTVDEVEQELIDVGLVEYCRPAMERLRRSSQAE